MSKLRKRRAKEARKKSRFRAYERWFNFLNRFVGPDKYGFMTLAFLNLIVVFAQMVHAASAKAVISIMTGDYNTEVKVDHWSDYFNLIYIDQLIFELPIISEVDDQFTLLYSCALFSLTVTIIIQILNFCSSTGASYIGGRTANRMQEALFKHYLTFSMGFFNTQRPGKVVSRMRNDSQEATSGISGVIENLLISPLLLVFFLVVTFNASWVLVVSILLAGFAHHVLSSMLLEPVANYTQKTLDTESELGGVLHEVFSNIRVVKSFGTEKEEMLRIREGLTELLFSKLKREIVNGIQKHGRPLINTIVYNVILIFAGLELIRGSIDVATCLTFIFICQRAIAPINKLSNAYVRIHEMSAASDRVYKYFRRKPDVVEGTIENPTFTQALEFQNTHFTYSGHTKAVKGVSFKLEKGKTIALVGPSGAGKSTIFDLALRFYDPHKGGIFLDGTNVRDFKQIPFRRLFGVVAQDPTLFNMSVYDNIRYGRETVGFEQVKWATNLANASEFVEEMEMKYDTILGDRGVRLSGGQRQRIAIARAIVSKPDILLLDEATSALDTASERLVQEAIENVTKECSTMIIAHRLSTVLHSDMIIVLDQGKIMGMGPHEELISTCPLYQKLYKMQFKESDQE